MVQKLKTTERETTLQTIPEWRYEPDRDAIIRDFKFQDFAEAFVFMTKVATLAEIADHHPEWSNVYNRVTILLTTHDASGLTQKDIALAREIDAL